MIEGNVIKFGYGDIQIRTMFDRIEFHQSIIPYPENIGKPWNPDVPLRNGAPVRYVSQNELANVLSNLKKVESREITQFDFMDLTFDFDNFNKESVQAVRKCFEHIQGWYIRYSAC